MIERWTGKTWVKEKNTIHRIFTSLGYDIKPGDRRVFETDLNAYYPNLKKGRYRISKSYHFDKDRPISQDEVHWIYADFTIE